MDPELECHNHPDYKMEYNCRKCQKVGCKHCMSENHQDHDTESATEGLDRMKAKTTPLLNAVISQQQELQANIDSMSESIDKCKNNMDDTKAAIQNETDKLKLEVETHSSVLIEAVEDNFDQQLFNLETAKKDLMNQLYLLTYTRNVVDKKSDHQVLSTLQGGLHDRVVKYQNEAMKGMKDVDFSLVEFVPKVIDDNIIGIITTRVVEKYSEEGNSSCSAGTSAESGSASENWSTSGAEPITTPTVAETNSDGGNSSTSGAQPIATRRAAETNSDGGNSSTSGAQPIAKHRAAETSYGEEKSRKADGSMSPATVEKTKYECENSSRTEAVEEETLQQSTGEEDYFWTADGILLPATVANLIDQCESFSGKVDQPTSPETGAEDENLRTNADDLNLSGTAVENSSEGRKLKRTASEPMTSDTASKISCVDENEREKSREPSDETVTDTAVESSSKDEILGSASDQKVCSGTGPENSSEDETLGSASDQKVSLGTAPKHIIEVETIRSPSDQQSCSGTDPESSSEDETLGSPSDPRLCLDTGPQTIIERRKRTSESDELTEMSPNKFRRVDQENSEGKNLMRRPCQSLPNITLESNIMDEKMSSSANAQICSDTVPQTDSEAGNSQRTAGEAMTSAGEAMTSAGEAMTSNVAATLSCEDETRRKTQHEMYGTRFSSISDISSEDEYAANLPNPQMASDAAMKTSSEDESSGRSTPQLPTITRSRLAGTSSSSAADQRDAKTALFQHTNISLKHMAKSKLIPKGHYVLKSTCYSICYINNNLWCYSKEGITKFDLNDERTQTTDVAILNRAQYAHPLNYERILVSSYGLYKMNKDGTSLENMTDEKFKAIHVTKDNIVALCLNDDVEVVLMEKTNPQPLNLQSFNLNNKNARSLLQVDKYIYVSFEQQEEDYMIAKYTLTGKQEETYGKFGSGKGYFYSPELCLTDNDHSILVADRDHGELQVQILDSKGKWSVCELPNESDIPLSGINQVVITPNGRLMYVLAKTMEETSLNDSTSGTVFIIYKFELH